MGSHNHLGAVQEKQLMERRKERISKSLLKSRTIIFQLPVVWSAVYRI
jgi:hypothetical protein